MRRDIAVVGAGAIGLDVAWQAAELGLKVDIFEIGKPGRGASSVAAGVLSPVDLDSWKGTPGLFNSRAVKAWPDYVARLNEKASIEVKLREDGIVHVPFTPDEIEVLEQIHLLSSELGVESELLQYRELSEVVDGLRNFEGKAIFYREGASVDPEQLIVAQRQASEALGVAFLQAEVVDVDLTEDGDVVVRTSGGSARSYGQLVIATGAWTGSIQWIKPELQVPVEPIRGDVLVAEDQSSHRDNRTSKHEPVTRSFGGSITPRGGGLYALGVTKKATRLDDLDPELKGIAHIIDNASKLKPHMSELRLREIRTGFRPATPDGLPALGRVDSTGLIFAVGHGAHGILQAPVSTEIILAELGVAPNVDLGDSVSPSRFRT